MTRAALLLPSLFLVACTVGERSAGGGGGDDGSGSGSGSGSNQPGCVDALTADKLQDAHMHTAGGSDNHGQDCTAMGCHKIGATGTDAPAFRYAGTVYAADGTTPSMGGVVTFTPMAGGDPIPYYTDKGGNFYVMMDDGQLPSPFSGNVAATTCPTIRKMSSQVTDNEGCTGTSCHSTGGGGGTLTVGLPM